MDRGGGSGAGYCYHTVLGIRRDASFSELRSAYRKLAKVSEEVERAIWRSHDSSLRAPSIPVGTSEESCLRLQFFSKLPAAIFASSQIKAEDGTPLRIELVDGRTNERVTSGPLFSIELEIVVLDGDFGSDERDDWTEKEFNRNIVREREGKRPLITGELGIILQGGSGCLGDFVITDNSSWMRSRKFRLGARAVLEVSAEIRIREARSEAFIVKKHRGGLNKKHYPPSLSDEVWRLMKIAKDGALHKRLTLRRINTVQDFLQLYEASASSLRDILGTGITNRVWETIARHASSCVVDDNKMYAYFYGMNSDSILFNSVLKVAQGTLDGQTFQSLDKLTHSQKILVQNLKKQAYYNKNRWVPFDALPSIAPPRALTNLPAEPSIGLRLPLDHLDITELNQVQAAVVTASSIPIPPNQVSILKRPITPPPGPGLVDYQNPDHEQLMKRLRTAQSVEEVTYPIIRQQASWSLEDLPRTVALTLHQGSAVTSMDFHPAHPSVLLVGCANGEITLWELVSREKLVTKPFKVWDMASCSVALQAAAAAAKDSVVSVTRVTWSPDGNFIGAAFTKHLVHLYACPGSNDLRQQTEIDAHTGAVNDLAFAYPDKQLCAVTCGDDKLIKVWDLNGWRLFNFEGHEAPVYSICPHHKENIQFIFSTAIDGKIKAWLYDNLGSRVDYDAPGHWCTTMLYSADGSRLFLCGTSKEGESFLVEWHESEGAIKRTYSGFSKKSAGVVQFDTTQNHFLAAGEDGQIKFWEMDNKNVIATTDAEGGLQSLPRLRFNKEGNLLAVTAADNGVKILANAVGLRYLKVNETPALEALRTTIESAAVSSSPAVANASPVNCKIERSSPVRPYPLLNGVDSMGRNLEKPRVAEEAVDKTRPWQLTEITDPGHCRLVTMPDRKNTSSKVVRLLYTNSGVAILALAENGVQKLWKWAQNYQNPSGKATASVVPQHWQPRSGRRMANDVSGVNLDEAVPCIALSKNDSYVMSACGGKVSLFNMMTFKVVTTFMPPPPASTFLAFHPQNNNIIAIGMEDSTIHIYNVRVDEVKSRLKGHQKRITGLAFSTNLNILVSSGADAQLFLWSIDSWDKRKSVPIQIPAGKAPNGDTRVQFHADQIRLLVVHETQLAIYDASKMDRIRQWVPQDALSAPISCAAFSCNSLLVYATFCDGNIGVFDADNLRLRCRIAPSTYLSHGALNGSQPVHPLVVATHPLEPNQLAVGLTDGSVKVMEPAESDGKWGATPPLDNGMLSGRTPSSSTSNHTPEPVQR